MRNCIKSALALLLVLILSLGLGFSKDTQASQDISVVVEAEEVKFLDQEPYLDENNRVQVPIRFVAEELGAEVGWDGTREIVTIIHSDSPIEIPIGESYYYRDDREVQMDTEAVIKNERTMVPLRFVSEALGHDVEWKGRDNLVMIEPPHTQPEHEWADEDMDDLENLVDNLSEITKVNELERIYESIENYEEHAASASGQDKMDFSFEFEFINEGLADPVDVSGDFEIIRDHDDGFTKFEGEIYPGTQLPPEVREFVGAEVEIDGFLKEEGVLAIKIPFLWEEFDIEKDSYVYIEEEEFEEEIEREFGEEVGTSYEDFELEDVMKENIKGNLSPNEVTIFSDITDYLSDEVGIEFDNFIDVSSSEMTINNDTQHVDVIEVSASKESIENFVVQLINIIKAEDFFEALKDIEDRPEDMSYDEYLDEVKELEEEMKKELEEIEDFNFNVDFKITDDKLLVGYSMELYLKDDDKEINIAGNFEFNYIDYDYGTDTPTISEDDVDLEKLLDDAFGGGASPSMSITHH